MKRIVIILLGSLFSLTVLAQQEQKYTITGSLIHDSLRFSPQRLETLYLEISDSKGKVILDSVKVRNRQFAFSGVVPDSIVRAAFIKGFDNGSIMVFIEPGHITLSPFDARFPATVNVGGTRNNDIWQAYRQLYIDNITKSRQRMVELRNSLPDSIASVDTLFYPYQYATYHSNSLYYKTDVLKFLRQNIDSEAALYIMQGHALTMFSPQVVERQFLRALPLALRNHPVYLDMTNKLKADNLKVGSKAPDITGLTPDGGEVKLSDFEGRYVLLDIWASWCAPCRREFPYMKQALKASEGSDKVIIVSYSIDDNKGDWMSCIAKNDLRHPHWIHISSLMGWESDAVDLYGVEGVPYTVLLNPRGEVISFNLRGDEMVSKLKDILSGKVKYE